VTDLTILSSRSSRPAVTMTSLELVDFINDFRREQATKAGVAFPSKGYAKLEHSDFLKKVPEVLGAAVAGNFSGYYTASNGKANPLYTFPKREAVLLAMSYSYELQALVYDRMTALEEQAARPALPDFTDPATAAIAWAEQYRAKTAAEAQAAALVHEVAAQAPKVEFHDQVVQSDQLLDLGETGKLLGTGRTRLCRWMRENRWLNRYNEPYQDKIEAGLLDLKYSKPWTHPEKGEVRSITTMVTGKGLARLHKAFAALAAAPPPGVTREPPPAPAP